MKEKICKSNKNNSRIMLVTAGFLIAVLISSGVMGTVTLTELRTGFLGVEGIGQTYVFASQFDTLQDAVDALDNRLGGRVIVDKRIMLNETLNLTTGFLEGDNIDRIIEVGGSLPAGDPLIRISREGTDPNYHCQGVRDLRIDGNGASNTLIQVDDDCGGKPYDVIIERVWFYYGGDYVIDVHNVSGESRLIGCWFEHETGEAFRILNDDWFFIDHCYFTDGCINVTEDTTIQHITNNVIKARYGINMTGGAARNIQHNVFLLADKPIVFQNTNPNGFQISNNAFDYCVDACIYLNGTSNPYFLEGQINDNKIRDNGNLDYFIKSDSTFVIFQGTTVTGNVLDGNPLTDNLATATRWMNNDGCIKNNAGHNPYGNVSVALPGGTGSANKIKNYYGCDVRIWCTGGDEIHIIDRHDVDVNLTGDPDFVILGPSEQIYFDQTVATEWTWMLL